MWCSCVSWSQNVNSLIGGQFNDTITEPGELAWNFLNRSIVFVSVCFALKGNISLGNKYWNISSWTGAFKKSTSQHSRCNSEIPFQSPATFSTDVNITFKSLNHCWRIWSNTDGPPTSPSDITRKRRRNPARQQVNAAPKMNAYPIRAKKSRGWTNCSSSWPQRPQVAWNSQLASRFGTARPRPQQIRTMNGFFPQLLKWFMIFW